MEPGSYKITLHVGTVWRKSLRFAMGSADGTPRDLTGCTFAAQVRDVATLARLASIAVTPGDLAAGEIALALDDRDRSVSSLLAPFALAWDLLITPAGGEPEKVLAGTVEIERTITVIA